MAGHALLSIEAELLAHREMGRRTIEAIATGQQIGIAPSVLKVVSTRLTQRLSEVALDMTGGALAGRLAAEDGGGQNHPVEGVEWLENFLYLWSRTIVGGTTEVQENMIARTLFGDRPRCSGRSSSAMAISTRPPPNSSALRDCPRIQRHF